MEEDLEQAAKIYAENKLPSKTSPKVIGFWVEDVRLELKRAYVEGAESILYKQWKDANKILPTKDCIVLVLYLGFNISTYSKGKFYIEEEEINPSYWMEIPDINIKIK